MKKKNEPKTISIYTDGAFSRKNRSAGIGVFMQYGNCKKYISHGVPFITNNVAELLAIEIALRHITDKNAKIRLFTDSLYCQGVLTKGWSVNANIRLVAHIKRTIKLFPDLKVNHVKGHAGNPGNEMADKLASYASVPSEKLLEQIERMKHE